METYGCVINSRFENSSGSYLYSLCPIKLIIYQNMFYLFSKDCRNSSDLLYFSKQKAENLIKIFDSKN